MGAHASAAPLHIILALQLLANSRYQAMSAASAILSSEPGAHVLVAFNVALALKLLASSRWQAAHAALAILSFDLGAREPMVFNITFNVTWPGSPRVHSLQLRVSRRKNAPRNSLL